MPDYSYVTEAEKYVVIEVDRLENIYVTSTDVIFKPILIKMKYHTGFLRVADSR